MINAKKAILFIEGMVLCLYSYCHFTIPCFFKILFHVPCPGCGMTRAFREIIHFNFVKSFKYNILGFPFFIFILLVQILLIYDIIYSKDKISVFFRKITKYTYIILLFVMIGWIVNILRGI